MKEYDHFVVLIRVFAREDLLWTVLVCLWKIRMHLKHVNLFELKLNVRLTVHMCLFGLL